MQGFPSIKKSIIIEVWRNNQNIFAQNVVVENLFKEVFVGIAEKKSSEKENVNFAEKNLNGKKGNGQEKKLVQNDVLINCEDGQATLKERENLIWSVRYAGKLEKCPQHIKGEIFAQLIVGVNTILGRIAHLGKEGLPQNEQCLIRQENGKTLVKLSGDWIMQLAEDVEKDLITHRKLLKSIIKNPLDTENLEQKLKILCLFVFFAISGYIPTKIQGKNLLKIEINSKFGWTEGLPKTIRKFLLGNALTPDIPREIFKKLIKTNEKGNISSERDSKVLAGRGDFLLEGK
jgi:hypothetical protein